MLEDTAMLEEIGLPIGNNFERISFAIFDADVAAASQKTNFNLEKVNLAWRQALSLGGTVAPVNFEPARPGEEALLNIRFVRDGHESGELSLTIGHITRTPRDRSAAPASELIATTISLSTNSASRFFIRHASTSI